MSLPWLMLCVQYRDDSRRIREVASTRESAILQKYNLPTEAEVREREREAAKTLKGECTSMCTSYFTCSLYSRACVCAIATARTAVL